MGIYIKGMEMPTSCRACLYSRTDIRNVDWCVLTEKDLPCDCPLVPVPPHGDLIDRDALIDDLKRQCKEVFRIDAVSPEDFWINRNEAYRQRLWQTWCEGFYEYVGSRPTIIPANA